MRIPILIMTTLALGACDGSRAATDLAKARERAKTNGPSVVVPVPDRKRTEAPQGMSETDRFRQEFADDRRFVFVNSQSGLETYVLDLSSGCAYHQDERRGRDPVLLENGRPDCTYAER